MELQGTLNTRCFSEIDSRLSNHIVRSDRIDYIFGGDVELLLDQNIKTIIDLRKPKNRDSIVLNDTRFDYRNISFDINSWKNLDTGKGRLNKDVDAILLEEYSHYVDQFEVITSIFKTIINSADRVLLMCHHGKDRTGVVSALLLLIAGMDDEIIVQDYSISSYNLSKVYSDEKLMYFKSKPEIMQVFLQIFRNKYITVENYLFEIGLNIT